MSGPKVVRVVTREELVAAGESLLRRLDAAVVGWHQECAAMTQIAESDLQQVNARKTALEAMLRQDKFAEFGKAAAAEIDFLEADAARRLQAAAQARARERARLEIGREVAAAFLRGSVPLSDKIRLELGQAVAGNLSVTELDAVLSSAARSLHTQDAPGLSDSQRSLASRLAGSEQAQTFEQWKAGHLQADPRLQSLLEQMSELELLGESAAAVTLKAQWQQVQSVQSGAERQLRLDSLQIAFRKAKEAGVRRRRALKEANLLGAELGSFGEAALSSVRDLQALSTASGVAELEGTVDRARRELEMLQGARAAAARRRAVLDGLTKLGYSVNEGLSTATPNAGKLVVRTPGSSDYGVEISGAGTSERLQVRSVAFSTGRNPSGDIPAEQRWCGDFGKLQATLKAQGCEVVVEKALGVGAVPLKVVEASVEEERRRSSAPAPARRVAK
jgi:hypothetical protein